MNNMATRGNPCDYSLGKLFMQTCFLGGHSALQVKSLSKKNPPSYRSPQQNSVDFVPIFKDILFLH